MRKASFRYTILLLEDKISTFTNSLFSPLINSADSCSFIFLSFFLSIFPPFFDLHVIHLIYQVKGISGHQWGCVRVCAGVYRCARVCTSVHGCTGCVRVCMGVQWEGAGVGESMRVCGGVHGCARVCTGVRDCARVCIDLHWGTHVCVG